MKKRNRSRGTRSIRRGSGSTKKIFNLRFSKRRT